MNKTLRMNLLRVMNGINEWLLLFGSNLTRPNPFFLRPSKCSQVNCKGKSS